jgi:hypothetical protein
MTNINNLVYYYLTEATKPPQRFKPKTLRKTIQKQRSTYAGLLASQLARQRNKSLSDRKKFYRQKYLQLKQKEQQLYGSRARSLARRK